LCLHVGDNPWSIKDTTYIHFAGHDTTVHYGQRGR
jgi:hypothetical protein